MNLQKISISYKSLNLALKSGLWFAIISIIQRGINFILLPVFTKIMSLEEFGTVSLYNSWLSFTSLLVTLNISGNIYHIALTKYKNQNNVIFFSSILVAFGLLLVLTLFLSILNIDFTQLGSVLNLLMFVQIFSTIPYILWIAESRYNYEFRWAVIAMVLQAVLSVLISLFCLKTFENNVISYIAGPIISNTILSLVALKNYRIKIINLKKIIIISKYLLFFGLGTVVHFIGAILLVHADRVIIDKLLTINDVAIYSLGYSFGMILMLIPSAVGQSY